jgi:DNA-binding transcriptional LysR family regulator
MAARTQLSAADLDIMLALSRAGTLAGAGRRLGLDASTVFRAVKRAEKSMGQRLFERSATGYRPTEVALRLSAHAETIERALEAARNVTQSVTEKPTGLVRVSAVDAVLNHMLLPALAPLAQSHAQLSFEFAGDNDLANLTQREVDIAVRSTQRPPGHLVGLQLATLQFAVYAAKDWARRALGRSAGSVEHLAQLPWVGIDAAMPDHPGVAWRKRQFPGSTLRTQGNSMLTVTEAVAAGMGIGVLAVFHAAQRADLVALTGPLEDCHVELWLLTHPESRHQPRIAAVARHLAQQMPPLVARLQKVSTTRPKGRSSTR